MIDHVSVPVRDLAAGVAFYARVLAPLGYVKLVERTGSTGFGKKYPEIWLNLRADLAAAPSNPRRTRRAAGAERGRRAGVSCCGTRVGRGE
jgi:catechol 2,3-dioxygenase-like lactoylglutathione lyase family enzyme